MSSLFIVIGVMINRLATKNGIGRVDGVLGRMGVKIQDLGGVMGRVRVGLGV